MYKTVKERKPKYCPIGSAGNGRPNHYEVGLCDQDFYDDEEFEFLKAIDRYKHDHDRPFPTWHEVLQVFKSLGYRKETHEAQVSNGQRQTTQGHEAGKAHPLPSVQLRAEEHGPHRLCG